MRRIPPHAYFVTSAVFHYLGPALAVLLFAKIAPLGVAWLRIASAAVVFAAWRRPWRAAAKEPARNRVALVALGATLAAMNCVFYLAIERLPLATVGAIEFLGPLLLAALGVHSGRNAAALTLAVLGVGLLTRVQLTGDPLGVTLAFANCALFVAYVVLGARIAADGGATGIDRLGLSMLVAAVLAGPVGIGSAAPAFTDPLLLAAGIGVGVCSSVVPYVCDQLALARLPRATFALMMALLPATATVIGVLVLHQVPAAAEIAGIALVVVGIAVHTPSGRQRGGSVRRHGRVAV
jgi:inner membrane transporter RhtA